MSKAHTLYDGACTVCGMDGSWLADFDECVGAPRADGLVAVAVLFVKAVRAKRRAGDSAFGRIAEGAVVNALKEALVALGATEEQIREWERGGPAAGGEPGGGRG